MPHEGSKTSLTVQKGSHGCIGLFCYMPLYSTILLVLVSQQEAHKKSEDDAVVARDHGAISKQIQTTLTTAPAQGSVATKANVLFAELLWAMKVCSAHYSHNSCESSGLLFQKMFPDSGTASSFTCGEMKSSYLINYALAPYFKPLL